VPNRADSLPGQLAATGRELLVADKDHPHTFAVAAPYLDAGLTNALAVPLSDRGQVIGVLAVRSGREARFGDEEARFLRSLASLVATGLQRARSDEALNHAQRLESVGQLTGGIAHDFNNLLTVISGNLQIMEDAPAIGQDPALQQMAEAASKASKRAAQLTEKLLAFSRRQVLQPSFIDVGALLHSLAEMLRRTLDQRIRIEVHDAAGPLQCLADRTQLESALLNIAINARDAMADGGTLSFTMQPVDELPAGAHALERGPPGTRYVAIAVHDTGPGMSDTVVERACEPFFTTKPEGVGTGLGLSMAYGFVKQTGGHFKIYSEVDEGTTVRMYFPRSFEAEAAVARLTGGPAQGGTETILVVEDDPAVHGTVVEMLGSLGYRVLKADNAHDALGIVKSGIPIDLLFTDVVMPGPLRSPELARQAKALLPGLAVLFTSGYTQNAIVHGGRLDPGVELLSKPYGRDQLARKVRHLLANRAIPAAPAPGSVAASGARRRILVAEDNPDLMQMTCSLFETLGHEVRGATTFDAAAGLLRESPFDLLFTDIDLAGKSGVELARIAARERPALRVAFASGYGGPERHAVGFPFWIVPKPYRLDDLKGVLERMV
jgi:signal transduction histidine kinase/DNA-binding response OmpR family regulator